MSLISRIASNLLRCKLAAKNKAYYLVRYVDAVNREQIQVVLPPKLNKSHDEAGLRLVSSLRSNQISAVDLLSELSHSNTFAYQNLNPNLIKELSNFYSSWLISCPSFNSRVFIMFLNFFENAGLSPEPDAMAFVEKWFSCEGKELKMETYVDWVDIVTRSRHLDFSQEFIKTVASAGLTCFDRSPQDGHKLFVNFFSWWTSRNRNPRISEICPEVVDFWFTVTRRRINKFSLTDVRDVLIGICREKITPLERWQETMKIRLTEFKSGKPLDVSNLLLTLCDLPDVASDELIEQLASIVFSHFQKQEPMDATSIVNTLWTMKTYRINPQKVDPNFWKDFWELSKHSLEDFDYMERFMLLSSFMEFGVAIPHTWMVGLAEGFDENLSISPNLAARVLECFAILETTENKKQRFFAHQQTIISLFDVIRSDSNRLSKEELLGVIWVSSVYGKNRFIDEEFCEEITKKLKDSVADLSNMERCRVILDAIALKKLALLDPTIGWFDKIVDGISFSSKEDDITKAEFKEIAYIIKSFAKLKEDGFDVITDERMEMLKSYFNYWSQYALKVFPVQRIGPGMRNANTLGLSPINIVPGFWGKFMPWAKEKMTPYRLEELLEIFHREIPSNLLSNNIENLE